jgi:hypothetical protein
MKEIYILGNIPPSSVVGYRVEKAVRGRVVTIENRVDYWPLPLGEVEAEVRVVPRNGFTGEVRLSSSGSTSVSVRATDNRGRGLKEGTLEVRVNDPAPAPRVTTWTIKENSEVPFDPGSLVQASLPEQVNTFYRSEVRAEVAGYVYNAVPHTPISLAGFPVAEVGIYGESGGRSVLAYGALVEATFDPAWLLDGCSYYLPSISSAGYTQLTKQDILDRKLYLNEPGSRPWAEGHQYEVGTSGIYDKVEKVIGKDLRVQLDKLEQGLGSLQDVRKLLVEREENLRKEVQKVGGKDLLGDYYWDVRSQLFFFDPSGSTVLPWKGSVGYSGVNRY